MTTDKARRLAEMITYEWDLTNHRAGYDSFLNADMAKLAREILAQPEPPKVRVWRDPMTDRPTEPVEHMAYINIGYLQTAKFDGMWFYLTNGTQFGPKDGDRYMILDPLPEVVEHEEM